MDPNTAPLRGPPRDGRDLVIAASNSHIVALDNLSSIKDWLSDALCRVATGDGFATRELYTNGEETIFEGARPILLTGIEDVITRGDLADRAIPLCLPRIPDAARRTEAALWADVDCIRPGVLGALLDACRRRARRLRVRATPAPPPHGRFRYMGSSHASPRCRGTKGDFLAAYDDARDHMVETGIEADLVATAVVAMLGGIKKSGDDMWSGTAQGLLETLNGRRADGARPPKGWPETPRAMSGRLTRAAPLLRGVGIELIRYRGKDSARQRMIRLNWHQDANDRPDSPDGADRPDESPHDAWTSDGSDGMDGPAHPGANDTQRPTSDLDDFEARARSSRYAPPPELDLWTGGPQESFDTEDADQSEGAL